MERREKWEHNSDRNLMADGTSRTTTSLVPPTAASNSQTLTHILSHDLNISN
jgi:hypothetical protein